MIDNDTQSTMKQVRTNQRITHRHELYYSVYFATQFSLREIKMKCIGLDCGIDVVLKRGASKVANKIENTSRQVPTSDVNEAI